jgi:cyclopropane fatty-acyl-phospholipid synthase-like methyltransferase
MLFPDFAIEASNVVIDIGSGAGDAFYIASRAGAAVITLDNQPEKVRYVDQRMQDSSA